MWLFRLLCHLLPTMNVTKQLQEALSSELDPLLHGTHATGSLAHLPRIYISPPPCLSWFNQCWPTIHSFNLHRLFSNVYNCHNHMLASPLSIFKCTFCFLSLLISPLSSNRLLCTCGAHGVFPPAMSPGRSRCLLCHVLSCVPAPRTMPGI